MSDNRPKTRMLFGTVALMVALVGVAYLIEGVVLAVTMAFIAVVTGLLARVRIESRKKGDHHSRMRQCSGMSPEQAPLLS